MHLTPAWRVLAGIGVAGALVATGALPAAAAAPVDLAAGPSVELSAAPGGRFTIPLSVTNAGESTAVENVNAVFDHNYALRATEKFSNCTYTGDRLRSCAFDVTIAPGATYAAGLPAALGADTFAPGQQYGSTRWLTRAEFADYLSDVGGIDVGQPGTGRELELTKLTTKARRGGQTDTQPDNNLSSVSIKVTGENGFDFRAQGARITGAIGDEAVVNLGFRNDGPAAADRTRGPSEVSLVDVEVPDGTTAVTVPETCWPTDEGKSQNWGKPARSTYRCLPGSFVAPDQTVALAFTLRIDRAQVEAGSVAVNVRCECDSNTTDLNPANDSAPIEVTIAAADGGGLPVTGPAVGLIAAGALLLVAGLTGIVVARRRRTHFVA